MLMHFHTKNTQQLSNELVSGFIIFTQCNATCNFMLQPPSYFTVTEHQRVNERGDAVLEGELTILPYEGNTARILSSARNDTCNHFSVGSTSLPSSAGRTHNTSASAPPA